MIVTVSHPAAVAHVPAGSRKRRVSLARVMTQAEIRTLAREDVGPVTLELTSLARPTYMRSSDALWEPMLRQRLPQVAVRAEWLSDYLSDPGAANVSLHGYFWRTPVLAFGGAVVKGMETRVARGWEVDVDASRSVDRDDRTVAASALRTWLDGNVRILDGEAYLRRYPLATHERTDKPDGVWTGLACGGPLRDRQVAAAPNSYPSLAAGWLADAGSATPWEIRAWLDLDLGHVLEGGERRRAIDGIPDIARRHLEAFKRRHPGVAVPEGVEALLEGAEIDALTGLGGLGDHDEGLRRLERILSSLAAWGETQAPEPIRVQLDAIRLIYRPSLPEPPFEPEDAVALSTLA